MFAATVARPEVFLSRRSEQREVMDDPEVEASEYLRCLSELAQVNRLMRAHAPAVTWLSQQLERAPRGRKYVVLDVGCGHGDLLRALARWAGGRGLELELHGVDLNPRSAPLARAATPPEFDIEFHTGDVFGHQSDVRPDFIVSSQFTHHLDDAELTRFVQWCEANARRAWLISDLERSAVAFFSFPLLCALKRLHDIVKHDGQVSIARSLRKQEWDSLLARAGIEAKVTPQFPFRLAISSAHD